MIVHYKVYLGSVFFLRPLESHVGVVVILVDLDIAEHDKTRIQGNMIKCLMVY